MHISEIVIDGFKSYATRTVISGFDASFNAITGLNGSGKSNILDAICFVLGISNLSQVRASNLQDLVYKQGQGGVNKATVSIVFANDDPKQSPAGYEHCETITVTRTIVIGGRNKYLINGHAVQANAVQDFFHSVQLNVNNPHFLIMQGRITKVLNMKPPEVLGMIEEAAGTRMYEAKKQAAVKTIEKKQVKVEEINKILDEEISPTIKRLQEERKAYLEWANNNTNCERMARLCVAYEYCSAEKTKQEAIEGQKKAIEESKASLAKIAELKEQIKAKEAELKQRETAKASALSTTYKKLMDDEQALGKEVAKSQAQLANKKKNLKEEEAAYASLLKQKADCEAALQSLQAQLAKQKQAAQEAQAAAATASSEVAAASARYNAAAAGMMSDDAGGAGGGAANTVEGALMQAKAQIDNTNSEIASSELRINHLKKTVKDLEKASSTAAAEHAQLQAAVSKTKASLDSKQAKLASLGFNNAAEEALRARRDELSKDIEANGDRIENSWASVSHLVELSYDAGSLGAGFDRRSIKGAIAALLKMKKPEGATAVEVAAGGKLFQVVVDDEKVAKTLLDKGRLRKRVTFVPLNKVTSHVVSNTVAEKAFELSKGKCVPALSYVSFDDVYRPAMEYALGNTLICTDAATAKLVCFHPEVRTRVVTLDGDVFDPSGTVEGGSKPNSGGGGSAGGGQPLLVRLPAIREAVQQLEAKRAELKDIEAKLSSSAKMAQQFASLSSEVEIAAHELALAEKRLGSSQVSSNEAAASEAKANLAKEEQALTAHKTALKELQAKVATIEGELKNAAKAKEQRTAAAEKALTEAKKQSAAADHKYKKLAQQVDATACEIETNEKELKGYASQTASSESALQSSKNEVENLSSVYAELEGRYNKAKSALEAARGELAAADSAIKTLMKEKDAASRGIEDCETAAKKAAEKAKQLAKDASGADSSLFDLVAKHGWIESEKNFFGKPHTDYDFAANDPKKAAATLAALEKKQHELERKINKKVIGMIESAEREHADLLSKKRIIENDKAKIERVIVELDEKKNEALRTTWAKVNKDFGSIFSTLLPGVTAKLDPPEGGTVLDGLEVKVAFNGVWKETLTDLSGGQRSLLALSLILSLLLFKPAPMYILDEVDAALDLSHTQNIGKMIRTHFGGSQFVVVSLKQGMFNNANVIFRTKFVEGIGSTVTRTVPAGSALLTDGEAGSSSSSAGGKGGAAGKKTGGAARAGAGAGGAAAGAGSED